MSEQPPPEKKDILDILIAVERDGISIREAVRRTDFTRNQFYAFKERMKEDWSEFESEARSAGREARQEARERSDSRQIQATIDLRDRAAEILLECLPNLRRILTQDCYEAELPDGRKKLVVIYPRDVNAAIQRAQELAQFGTLPEGALPQSTHDEPPLPALSPPPAHFTAITLPPGTEVKIESPEVIEGETVEL